MGVTRADIRRMLGMRVMLKLVSQIESAGRQLGVDSGLIGCIIAHESQATERQWLGNTGEQVQVWIKGDSSSIGIGQIQVSLAKEMRRKYPVIIVSKDVVDDLLNAKRAVYYVAAVLADIQSNLTAWLKRKGATLAEDDTLAMVALGYNIGWPNLRDRNLSDTSFGKDIPARVATIRQKSRYLKLTYAYIQGVRDSMMWPVWD